MKPVRIFRHIECEGPGYLADVLQNYNIPIELVRIDAGDTPPSRIDDVSGLVFMGGSMSVNDELPWIEPELQLIRQAVDAGLPVLGHCLGGQLISKALGGEVTANPVKEIGWLPVEKIPGAASDDWLAGIADCSTVFHWHGERFSIPAGAEHILQSEHCAQQGFVIGNTLALQCHIEMKAEMVREWTQLYADEIADPCSANQSSTVQDQQAILENLEERIDQAQQTADKLYQRWLQPLIGVR